MCARKMHADEVDIDADLVRRLLATQFPAWADLPIERFESGGTVNAIYRLGDDMYVRLPLQEAWAWHLRREAKWLTKLAPHLPVAILEALAHGKPGEGYPFDWAVYRWLDGEPWRLERLRDVRESAKDLARFIDALRHIDTIDGQRPTGAQGASLAARDPWVRVSIDAARDMIDADALTSAWEEALELPSFEGEGVWVHADLLRGNVLVDRGRVSAVIDWGGVHVGDPAIDVRAAWTLLSGVEARAALRAALGVDDETWARARAWAIPHVGAIPYYRETNQNMVEGALHTIGEVLSDIAIGD